ncbi:MAG TPA: Rieske (2Fe-2S) protein [Nocardioides sp.]|uniref:Rieske (2Fe-2S) protein n=1 Tax=uncultured Nocardioides sp. TaxID=198441 RepID=UPI000EF07F95|nr:Rieske (2Fe-2S) protein [uncultured Nocardioides sp.]HCB07059.1 (2Fe-2S)-binding protein [Nocardioides sp.]HRD61868.1 Rieske (2Fe-2S) protein [Nocardioides sp.]HRI95006.1 Rieske (2Fe-2S) protein [Nocardioides sp.]HRK44893.1 Rieske (2Fe-2S) protein [Nocardioides sp.]
MTTDKISRRTLGGLAAAGVGVPLLAACSGDDSSTATDPAGTSSSAAPSTTTPSGSPSETAASSSAPAADALTTTGDVEVGGGSIFADQEVVVTQPSAGEFKCFSAICTHQGCVVSSVSDGTINCECHGSRFSIENGDVETGPATFPLEEVPINVEGDQISLA